jgi:hypothetical protein
MIGESRFDPALPMPYSEKWREAERGDKGDAPHYTSYQAPDTGAVVFALDSFSFRGGQSVETAEYPFGGLWSNGRLNERPQVLHINGYIRGENYIKIRNELIEALRVPTSDETPGYIDLPFWGRFPIVADGYEVSEKTDEKGQCKVSIDFTRAGVPPEARTAGQDGTAKTTARTKEAVEEAQEAVAAAFEEKLEGNIDANTLMAGFGKIKGLLTGALGRVRAAQTAIDAITAEINGISSLIAQGIRAPGELAATLFNALASLAAGLLDIKNAVESDERKSGGLAGGGATVTTAAATDVLYPAPSYNNEKNVLLYFFSAASYTMDIPAATAAQQNTKEAVENLYRAGALCAACLIITQTSLSYQKAQRYWNLLAKLEDSVDKNSPAVYTALENLRISVSRELSARDLDAELYRVFDVSLPLLYIAHYLGCDEAKLRELNEIGDSFAVKGGVVYV